MPDARSYVVLPLSRGLGERWERGPGGEVHA
jgi:hypothetical protein